MPIGCNQATTRPSTCGSKKATTKAPTANAATPNTTRLVRSVATYSVITNAPKKISYVPRSRSKTTTRLRIQTSRPHRRPLDCTDGALCTDGE
ncbi:hypothetical protein ACFXKC_51755 [Streptomyces sp. NPDC059340]|uniref:hypothetical protein n=1 Tax=Streptomyces sp. NPDC059340 TaxID=3346806 RepID=UPI0036AF040D